jgi:cell wall-associated NlpC family hydrolase
VSRHVSRAVAHRTARRAVRPAAGASAVVRFAYAQLGRPYVRNGEGRGGWDCSGLTKAAYARVGKRLAHKAARQTGRTVSRRQARPGDLVKWGSYHVGIYVGGGRVIHAPKPGDHVKRSRLWGSYRIVRVR